MAHIARYYYHSPWPGYPRTMAWEDLRGGVSHGGLSGVPGGFNGMNCGISSNPAYPPPNWSYLARSIIFFKDINFWIPGGASSVIKSATIRIKDISVNRSPNQPPENALALGLYACGPTVSDDDLLPQDWNAFTDLPMSEAIPFDSIPAGSVVEFPLNVNDLTRDGMAKFFVMEANYDHADVEPVGVYIPGSTQGSGSTCNSYTVPRTNAVTLVIDYSEVPMANLAVLVDPAGGGTIDNAGGDFPLGTVVPLTAMPSSGYAFQNWIIDSALYTENPIGVTMNANRVAIATFVPITEIPPPLPCPFPWWLLVIGAFSGILIWEAREKNTLISKRTR
jgi:hypothetical protein